MVYVVNRARESLQYGGEMVWWEVCPRNRWWAYLQVSAISSSSQLLSCASFLGMGEIATTKPFEWVSSMPKMVHALCVILRFSDDLSESYEV